MSAARSRISRTFGFLWLALPVLSNLRPIALESYDRETLSELPGNIADAPWMQMYSGDEVMAIMQYLHVWIVEISQL